MHRDLSFKHNLELLSNYDMKDSESLNFTIITTISKFMHIIDILLITFKCIKISLTASLKYSGTFFTYKNSFKFSLYLL